VPKERSQSLSNRTKILFAIIIVVLMVSYGLAMIYPQHPSLATPSPSSFTPSDWMSFIPSNVTYFRFLNVSFLAQYPLLFEDPLILSFSPNLFNITVANVTYGVDLQANNAINVTIIGLNDQSLTFVSNALASANLTSTVYNNVTLYRLEQNPTGVDGPAWVCIVRGVMVLGQGDLLAEQALQSIIDASPATFFNNDQLKVGYLLTWGGEKTFAFSYYQSGDNNYSVDWEMHSATNGSVITDRYSYHFPSAEVLSNKYDDAKKNLFFDAKAVYTSGSFMVGDFSFLQSEVRTALGII